MRQLKPIIITLCVVIVLGALAYLFFGTELFREKQAVAPSDSGTDVGYQTIYIVQKSAGLVKQVHVKTDFGEEFTIAYKGDNVTLLDADERFEYNYDDLDTLSGYVGILAAVEEIPINPGDDESLFGFNAPKRVISVDYDDGEHIELLLGAESPIDATGVYIKRVDTGKIYLIGGSSTEVLMKTLKDYRVINLFETYTETSSIQKASLTRPGEEPIAVEYMGAQDSENPVAPTYRMTSPVQTDASNDTLDSEFLTGLIAVKIKRIVEDYPTDFAKYGLDKPTVVSYEDTQGKKVTYSVGKRSEDGGRYIYSEGVPSVFETEEEISFLDLKYTDIIMQLIWLYNSDEVASVAYTLPDGTKHELKMNVDGENFSASYDGRDISKDNAVGLFLLTIRFTLQGAVDDSMKYGNPEYTMQITLKTGKTATLALSRINERQYAASLNGEKARYYVGVAEVKELADAFTTIANGETIPSMF